MTTYHKNMVPILVAFVLGISACAPPPLKRPLLPGEGLDKDALQIEASCSQTIPSTAVVFLTWGSQTQHYNQLRIDLTAYKDGFGHDRYATFWPLRSGEQPQKLDISKLRKPPREPTLVPQLKSISSDPQDRSTTVRIEGLEGGLVYQFRLVTLSRKGWTPGPVVRVEAPVCITEQFNHIVQP